MNVNYGSFRDPAGSVYSKNGDIYRSVFRPGATDFEVARDSGVYERLIEKGLLIPHKEVDALNCDRKDTVYCLSHPPLPIVSYPWEWSFSMLKDAALLHLDIMEMLIPMGFWLRDASAFNVQYNGERLYLIDTLSVKRRIPESPWLAYGQFCSHFLAPLATAAYCDIRMFAMWRNFINGFPLEMAVRMLPGLRKYQPGLFMHLTLHSRYQNSVDRKENIRKKKAIRSDRKLKINDRGLIGLIGSLKKTINSITWKRYSKIWEDYTHIRTYEPEDVSVKSGYVDKITKDLRPSMVWDLGANTGEFSLIAASHGAFVVSIDGDPACTESVYKKIFQKNGPRNILPLTIDLSNPSPGLGWDSRERSSLIDRGPADLLLALALVHHFVFSCCIPLSMIAQWFSKIANYVLVEFVPLTDPMVERLLANRNGEHHPYNLNVFTLSFEKYFVSKDSNCLQNGRTLFLYKRKK